MSDPPGINPTMTIEVGAEENMSSLMNAITDGNLEQVKAAINQGAELNQIDENGMTPYTELIELLIAAGAEQIQAD